MIPVMPSIVPVPEYDEDLTEAFSGPPGISDFFEEFEGAEAYDEEYMDEEDEDAGRSMERRTIRNRDDI